MTILRGQKEAETYLEKQNVWKTLVLLNLQFKTQTLNFELQILRNNLNEKRGFYLVSERE